MSRRGRFRVNVAPKAITDRTKSGHVTAETQANMSIDQDGDRTMLCISGPGLWARMEVTPVMLKRLIRKMAKVESESEVQKVYFPRKVPYSGASWQREGVSGFRVDREDE